MWRLLPILVSIGILAPASMALKSLNPPFRLSKIDHVVIRCRNYSKMLDFYTNVLGCTIDHPDDVGRFGGALTHLRAGESLIDLLNYDQDQLSEDGKTKLAQMHGGGQGITKLSDVVFSASTSTMDHLCVRVDQFNEEKMRSYLESHGVNVIDVGRRKGAEGVGLSLYLEDPEGNVVELKGPPELPRPQPDVKLEDSKDLPSIDTYKPTVSRSTPQKTDPATELPPKNDIGETTTPSDSFSVTPCTRICRYNADFYEGQVCIGCFRETFEIGTWSSMSDMERSYALLDAADRSSEEMFEGSVAKEELLRQARAWEERSRA
jgi:glyoxylase I family protein